MLDDNEYDSIRLDSLGFATQELNYIQNKTRADTIGGSGLRKRRERLIHNRRNQVT